MHGDAVFHMGRACAIMCALYESMFGRHKLVQARCYDTIVVGGGHAGVEAALAAARMGADTLLLTHNIDTIGQMSCNPAIGGIGKSHLVKEIDALGGVMAKAADAAGIHFRTLNASKGPAVHATRAQADRGLYKQYIRKACENQAGLQLFAQGVDDLIIEQGQVRGVITDGGLTLRARAVILTVGTFLAGQMHVGQKQRAGGRAGDRAATQLAKHLRGLGLPVARLKTGTPPRIDGRSIDYTKLAVQPGEQPCPRFSYMDHGAKAPAQVHCHIARTNAACHDIIRAHLQESAMYSGNIEGAGPRYCPSIEDKVVRFAERDQHQVFIEPEGLHTHEVYPNGISTSLPYHAQLSFVRAMVGFENAHITRPGYAIEYDFFDPRALQLWLESKSIKHLFFAGQINGTTGYEEAAAQGLLAAINAVRLIGGHEPWYPRRDEAYLGVLVDDLVTTGTKEPYRMFTSRAEWRLLLRQDNADWRLTEIGHRLGVVDDGRYRAFITKRDAVNVEMKRLAGTHVGMDSACHQAVSTYLGQPLEKNVAVLDLLKRPHADYRALMRAMGLDAVHEEVATQVTIQARYAGYIARQKIEVERLRQQENTMIPNDIGYNKIKGLSSEVLEKLQAVRPSTVGQASRIAGMTPAAISLLLVALKQHA